MAGVLLAAPGGDRPPLDFPPVRRLTCISHDMMNTSTPRSRRCEEADWPVVARARLLTSAAMDSDGKCW
jgi:hypothetical protein